VGEIVEEAEDDRERFLHAEEAVKRPFAMELEDGFAVGGLTSLTLVGDYVLADVVAFCWTVPEKEAALESLYWSDVCFKPRWSNLYILIRIGVASSPQLASLQTCSIVSHALRGRVLDTRIANLNAVFKLWKSVA